MRPPYALALLLLVAACGGTGKPPVTFVGTISGAPFTPAGTTGYLVEPTACAPLGEGLHALAWAQFSTVAGACEFAQASGFCAVRPDTLTAHVAIARSNANGGAVAPIGPGTYDPSTHGQVGADGVVNHFWAGVDHTDATCTPVDVAKEWTLDTLVLDEVGPSRLRGSASAHATDGSSLTGSFDVPLCAASGAAFCASLKGGCSFTTCGP
jgi:hypothetical protein